MLLREQTGIVLSATKSACPGSITRASSLSLKSGVPVGKAWRDMSHTGRGTPWGEVFWLWLSVRFAGIQAAKYVGAITGLQDVGWRVPREHQSVHLLIQRAQAFSHVVDSWSLRTSVPYFIAVQFCFSMCRGQQTKHSSTLFPYPPLFLLWPPPPSPLAEHQSGH